MPLSSMSILAPVSSWSRRIVLPPGPMIRPIFSGLIWIWISRGALAEISSRGRLIARSMARRISSRASWACSSVSRMISSVMPLFLRSSWIPGDAALGAGDLEVHVAEVVLVADDVGQEDVPAGGLVLDQADRDAADRVGDRHAGVHQAERGPADRGHRAGAVRFEDVGDHPDRVGELGRVGQDRGDRPLGEGSVADLAAAGPADRPDLADGERRHVVVEHELLAVLVHDAVDPLLVGAGAQHGGDQGLGLAALEDGRAVGPGQQADLAARSAAGRAGRGRRAACRPGSARGRPAPRPR